MSKLREDNLEKELLFKIKKAYIIKECYGVKEEEQYPYDLWLGDLFEKIDEFLESL